MFEPYRKIMQLMVRQEKRMFILLVGVMIATAFAEIMGLSAFMALLSVLAEPNKIFENEWLVWLYEGLGVETVFAFQGLLALMVSVVILTGLVIKAGSAYFVIYFAVHTSRNLSSRMLKAYLAQPYSWSLDRSSADMGRKILAECEQIISSVIKPSLGILASCFLAVAIVGFLIAVDPVVALLSISILGGGYFVIYLLVRKKLKDYGGIMVATNKQRYRVTLEATAAFKDVKLAGLEDVYAAEFDKPTLKRAIYMIKAQILTQLPRFGLEGLTFLVLLTMVLILLFRNDGNLLAAIPTLGIFAFSVMRILPALQQIYFGFAALRTGLAVVDVIHADYVEVHAHRVAMAPVDRTSRQDLKSELVFEDVSYTYPKAQKVALKNLSVTLKANSTIGIVGGTGAGKTTFIDLLLGLLELDSGRIMADGVSLEGDRVRAWQNTIGYVPQQIFLTDDTVAANIAFGVSRDEVDMAAVQRAAKTAALHDFVMDELEEGYDTPIGDRGVRLSGGQRQRIGIARALYHDPSLLILDEATSALDNITERAVMHAVQNLQGQKTIVMIAHRLSTVENCDVILLMEKGRVVAKGSFGDLAESNALFREMLGRHALEAS